MYDLVVFHLLKLFTLASVPKFVFAHNYMNIGGIWWHFGGNWRTFVARRVASHFFHIEEVYLFYQMVP